LAVAHTGQEGDPIDFESKVFHVGMLDHVVMEVADIEQVATLGLPKGDPDAPLVEVGFSSVDPTKPVILCIGHNVLPSVDIIDYMMDNDLFGEVEIGGICCTAHDMTRYDKRAKIIGTSSSLMPSASGPTFFLRLRRSEPLSSPRP